VESWFELWTGPTRATLGRPVTIAVQVAETDQPTTFEENGQTVTARITLPAALLRDGVEAVPFDLLHRVITTLETCGQRWLPEPLILMTEPDHEDQAPSPLTNDLETLEDDEMILLEPYGDQAGTAFTAPELDDYVTERVERSGAGEIIEISGGTHGVEWVISVSQ
jgi:hypothetical protein